MLDLQQEINSDLSVFHRIDDPMGLASSRYFEFVTLLPCYDGAVHRGLAALAQPVQPAEGAQPLPETGPPIPGLPAGARVVHISDARTAAAMSQAGNARAMGFPTVAYKGGG